MNQNQEQAENREAQQEAPGGRRGCDCPWHLFSEYWERRRQSRSCQHFRQAQKEFLKGIKALIDECLDQIDRKSEPRPERVTKIEVE